MGKVTPQEAFDEAVRKYEEGKALVGELTAYAQSVNKDFSFEYAMEDFDLLLQAVLLNVAVADGHFYPNEKIFIDKLTDYCDVMSAINAAFKEEDPSAPTFTWDIIEELSAESKAKLGAMALAVIDKYVQDFITPFAIIDKVLPKDYLKEFKEIFSYIMLCLAAVDGDDFESDDVKIEASVGFKAFEICFEKKWKEAMKKAK